MNPILKSLLTLSFLPRCPDLALLLLRAWLGLSIMLIHGLEKLQHFGATLTMYHDKMAIPAPFAAAAILSESVCAGFLVLGLATRWAAIFLATTMAVAFFMVHGAVLTSGDPKSGELAFIYLAGFLTVLVAGPGHFSIDAKLKP